MREFLLYGVASPLVLWFVVAVWRKAYLYARADAREAAALALARDSAPFARAYATVRALGGKIPACAPWEREENQRGVA